MIGYGLLINILVTDVFMFFSTILLIVDTLVLRLSFRSYSFLEIFLKSILDKWVRRLLDILFEILSTFLLLDQLNISQQEKICYSLCYFQRFKNIKTSGMSI